MYKRTNPTNLLKGDDMKGLPVIPHYPFSNYEESEPINKEWQTKHFFIDRLVFTEKLDGNPVIITSYGVLDRTGMPTIAPYNDVAYELQDVIKGDLGDLELLVENLKAVRSIEYYEITSYLYLFGIRKNGMWLGWDAVCYYARLFEIPMVPELGTYNGFQGDSKTFEEMIKSIGEIVDSNFTSFIPEKTDECSMEGVVCRNMGSFRDEDVSENMFKYRSSEFHALQNKNLDNSQYRKSILLHERK